MKCTIQGCGKPLVARGYCRAHYSQWYKRGDPLARQIAARGSAIKWLEEHSTHRGAACLPWPFKSRYRNGYGSVWYKGKLTGAHRVMCLLASGLPPEGTECAHSCGNRDCVNPMHLRWATGTDNASDKREHGTSSAGSRNPQAKLSEALVQEIRAKLDAGERQTAIAEQFGVSRRTISFIKTGHTWSAA